MSRLCQSCDKFLSKLCKTCVMVFTFFSKFITNTGGANKCCLMRTPHLVWCPGTRPRVHHHQIASQCSTDYVALAGHAECAGLITSEPSAYPPSAYLCNNAPAASKPCALNAVHPERERRACGRTSRHIGHLDCRLPAPYSIWS